MNNFQDIVNKFIDLGTTLIPFLAALALFAFALGVGRFIRSSDNDTNLKKSKGLLIWGIVGLFVLVSIWGIIAFLRGEFNLGNGDLVLPLLKTN